MNENNRQTAVQREIYSVARLTREARILLEGSLGIIWIEGEISNFSRPASGHWYFTLKDAQSQVRAAMFRTSNARLKFQPKDGDHVLLRARVSLYEGRGEFQLIAEQLEPAGEGLLRLQFEQLKQKLAAAGLFDEAHKQPLPAYPRRIGVITSPTGAAIRDILSVLQRRAPNIPVIIYPVPVQGEAAAAQIARMIARADQRRECDVLILTRGGGSLEDLWPFNEEIVARAIHACRTPIVSAVGHEIDFSISDFVADLRAPTPSAAAELVSPNVAALLAQMIATRARLLRIMQRHLAQQRQQLIWLRKQLVHPGARLRELAQRLDELHNRQRLALTAHWSRAQLRLAHTRRHLLQFNPAHRITHAASLTRGLGTRLQMAWRVRWREARQRLSATARNLSAVSPLATLSRGYAIVTIGRAAELVRDAQNVQPGERVRAQLAHGALECTVDKIIPDTKV